MSPRTHRRAAGRLTSGLVAGACAIAASLWPRAAGAYPTSIVFAPTGEAMPFGGVAAALYLGVGMTPDPVHFSSGWGGFDVGLLPSFDIIGTPAGAIAFGGGEFGIDVYGPDVDGHPTVVFNAKLQILKETKYWPALSFGVYQASPNAERGALLGYFAATKSIEIRDVELGQLTFGMMWSYAADSRIAPQCFMSGAPWCVFRGATPFEDQNGAFIAGWASPWIGPLSFGIDHVGGTSAVSSTNAALSIRLWEDATGGWAGGGVGAFFSNDRREPDGPGIEDGLFVQLVLVSSFAGLFGVDPTGDWLKDTGKPPPRRPHEDPFDAPPLVVPQPTPTPSD